jgi:predicted enzyme related to lactoylglutathione lyase
VSELITPLRGEPYHVAVVVPDLEAGMSHYGRLFGVAWGRPFRADLPVRLLGEVRTLTFGSVYSRGGAFRYELCEEIPGTVWTTGDGWHHLGYWSKDLAADSARLAAAGCPLAAMHEPDDGSGAMFAYHRGPQNSFIELVRPEAVRLPA